jgi:zinc protease
MRLTGSFVVTALFTLAAFAPPLLAKSGDVHETMLENGMKLLVKEDHRAPIVTSQVWYKVGASYEPAGLTGVSHVLEHMMFKGTKNHPPGEFSRIIAANGGQENAFTGADYTAYYQNLAADRLEISLELEADRMRNLLLLDEEFAKEVRVVMEERRLRTEDKPLALTYERFKSVAYANLPYQQPIIGWMNDLENLEADDLKQWYRKWYAPNNATLVVVGAVEPEQVFALAKKHFGPFQAEELPKLKPLREPPPRGETVAKVRAPAKQPYLIMGYSVPVLATAEEEMEPYALEMLAAILDGGDSARMSRELVRGQEIAVSLDADYSAFSRLSSQFTFDGIPAEGHSIDDLKQAILGQIERVRNDLADEAEMERVRAQIIASKVYELDSVFYQAMQLGLLETVGLGWPTLDEYVERIQAVTAEQVRQVANKYLSEERLTVAILDPLPLDAKTAKLQGAQYHGR